MNYMPNLDGTGPTGKGPKTGNQKGNCKDAKPKQKPLNGHGQGMGGNKGGRGMGLGRLRNNN